MKINHFHTILNQEIRNLQVISYVESENYVYYNCNLLLNLTELDLVLDKPLHENVQVTSQLLNRWKIEEFFANEKQLFANNEVKLNRIRFSFNENLNANLLTLNFQIKTRKNAKNYHKFSKNQYEKIFTTLSKYNLPIKYCN